MPVDFSVKRVPDALARQLRQRAARNRRSLQQELLAILEAAAADSSPLIAVEDPAPLQSAPGLRPKADRGARKSDGRLTLDQLWERARRLGGAIPGDSSASLVRADRDARSRR